MSNNEQQRQLQRLEDELARARRQNNYEIIRVLLRIKLGSVYGPKEQWKPKLKEDWNEE